MGPGDIEQYGQLIDWLGGSNQLLFEFSEDVNIATYWDFCEEYAADVPDFARIVMFLLAPDAEMAMVEWYSQQIGVSLREAAVVHASMAAHYACTIPVLETDNSVPEVELGCQRAIQLRNDVEACLVIANAVRLARLGGVQYSVDDLSWMPDIVQYLLMDHSYRTDHLCTMFMSFLMALYPRYTGCDVKELRDNDVVSTAQRLVGGYAGSIEPRKMCATSYEVCWEAFNNSVSCAITARNEDGSVISEVTTLMPISLEERSRSNHDTGSISLLGFLVDYSIVKNENGSSLVCVCDVVSTASCTVAFCGEVPYLGVCCRCNMPEVTASIQPGVSQVQILAI